MTSAITSRHFPLAPPLTTWRAGAWLASSAAGLVLWLQYPDPNWHLGMFLLMVSGVFLHPFGSLSQSVSFREIFKVLALVLVVFVVPIALLVLLGRSLVEPSWFRSAIKVAGVCTWLLGCIHVLRRHAEHRRLQASA